jgi:hypothetical protein
MAVLGPTVETPIRVHLVGETEERQGVFTRMRVHPQRGSTLCVRACATDGAEGHENFVAHAPHVDHDRAV